MPSILRHGARTRSRWGLSRTARNSVQHGHARPRLTARRSLFLHTLRCALALGATTGAAIALVCEDPDCLAGPWKESPRNGAALQRCQWRPAAHLAGHVARGVLRPPAHCDRADGAVLPRHLQVGRPSPAPRVLCRMEGAIALTFE